MNPIRNRSPHHDGRKDIGLRRHPQGHRSTIGPPHQGAFVRGETSLLKRSHPRDHVGPVAFGELTHVHEQKVLSPT